jgi:O-antigen/teichoic acid export membrane protein
MNPSQLRTKVQNILSRPGLPRDAGLMAAAMMISGLGSLIYWKIVTLRFSAGMVGLVSAGIASATFLGGLSNLGLTAGLVRFLPGQKPEVKIGLIRTANLIGLVTAVLVSAVFLSGRQWWAPNLVPPDAGPLYLVIFSLLLVLSMQLNLNGAVLQAERRIQYLIGQSTIINVVQIAGGLLVALSMGVTGILFTYMLPIFIVAIGYIWLFPRLGRYLHIHPAGDRGLLGDVIRYSLGSQVFSIVWSLPAFAFPLITLKFLGAEATAGLAITWFAYTFIMVIPNAISVALLVSGSHEPANLYRNTWRAIRINLIALTPTLILIIFLAPWVLGFFGTIYARAVTLLRLMMLSILPVSVNGIYLTLLRTNKRMRRLNISVTVLVLGSIAASFVLTGILGLNAIGWGWLAGQTMFSFLEIGRAHV